MRVAVSQFATSLNTQENLATCIRVINAAAVCKPSLIVLPEFCNTQPWYVDHNHAWEQALAINGTFLQRIAQQAKKHACYIVINVTVQRGLLRDHQNGLIKSNISVTSCLFSPAGELIHQVDKPTLTEHENDFFICANKVQEVVATPFGELGFLIDSDGASFEIPNELAIRGAKLLCNSMNSYALDQSGLHDPARAHENKVFLATANKIGPLMPQQQSDIFSAQSFIPPKYLVGVGQSQIVSPDGKVLAQIVNNEEGFVFADIEMKCSGLSINNKFRPDGTELSKQLRPELYQEQILAKQKQTSDHDNNAPETTNVAIFATYKSNEQAIEDVCHYIENNLSDIIQLPELFFVADKTITNDPEQLSQIACLSKQLISQVSTVLRPFQYVCTSVVVEGVHQAVLISEHGLFATQQQLHFCRRYQWAVLGNDLNIIELPLEKGTINVAMLTADDANIPAIVKVAALNDIHLLLVPFDIQESCEVEYSLLSRAAENRICIVAASREKTFIDELSSVNESDNIYSKNKQKVHKSTGLIANLSTDFALSSQWKSRKFNGYINKPIITHQHGKITKAVIHPNAACNKLMANKYI
ncbi:nitrilase-related carbon-nitrogen hydrolase [Thalassotalea fonticola]|uniref:Nitrilase-related carbon-nitrogen hydrolase n=1 Tax=Thalassotalea fonticola TaxID=3065649 RepID=A0ABZ0GMY0_9GAMM|nr:nitrilase-related carbon-nitrogen hydrolase [Colwelliaceae bacterium S1-1]